MNTNKKNLVPEKTPHALIFKAVMKSESEAKRQNNSA